jgi:hypothetical protein
MNSNIMDNEEVYEGRTYRSFRVTLDIGMGIFFISIGIAVLYTRFYGNMELSPTYANILGSLTVAYGIFRIYRGVSAFVRMHKERSARRRY